MTFGLTMSNLGHIADAFFLRTLDSLVIGVLITAFAAVLLRVLRKQSSAARFAVWFSALVAIAVLPWLDGELWSSLAHGQRTTSAAAFTVPSSWAVYFLAVWAVIAAIALARVGASLIHLYKLRKSFTKVDLNRLDVVTREMLERHQLNRGVDLCTSDQVSVPTAIGLIRPVVVIPAWLMGELSPAELNQILLHEFAHLRRWDDWTNLAQKIVKALFFFHPAVWWIERRISLEREMACDDAVLAESASPRAYAECLVHLAEKSVIRRGVALAQAAVGKIRQTSLRVAQILDVNRPAGASGWKPAVSLVAAFAVLSVIGISRVPKLVAFEDAPPRRMTASLPHPVTPAGKEFAAQKTSAPNTQIVNANFVTHPAQVLNPTVRLRGSVPPRAIVATDRRRSTEAESNAAQLVHLTEFNANPTTTGAMFVVVEQDAYQAVGQAIYRVSVWHIVVLQPAANSASRIPRKET